MDRPLIPGLAEELVAAAERMPPQRRRRRRFSRPPPAALAATAVVAVAVSSDLRCAPAAAGLPDHRAQRPGRVPAHRRRDPGRCGGGRPPRRRHRRGGDRLPVSPSIVGRFIGMTVTEGDRGGPAIGTDGVSSQGFLIPDRLSPRPPGAWCYGAGRLELRRALAQAGNALSAGEPLACLDLLRPPHSEQPRHAAHPGVSITVQRVPARRQLRAMLMAVTDAVAGPYADS